MVHRALNLLIIGQDGPLRSALTDRLDRHGRVWRAAMPGEELDAALRSLEPGNLIIDLLSFETVLYGTAPAWHEAAFSNMLEASRQHEAGVLMLSHASVFPWRERQRWQEHEEPEPHDAVGQSMRARERLLATQARTVLLRTGQVFDASPNGMLHRLLLRLHSGGAVRLPTEPRQAYTPATDLARVIAAMVDQLSCGAALWGVYHYQAADMLSNYELAERLLSVVKALGASPAVVLEPAGRPLLRAVAQLDCRRVRDTFGIQQCSIDEALLEAVRKLEGCND